MLICMLVVRDALPRDEYRPLIAWIQGTCWTNGSSDLPLKQTLLNLGGVS